MPRAPDDRELLELVGEVMGLQDVEEFRSGLLHALLRVVPAKWSSLNEVGPGGVFALVHPPLDQEWFVRFAELAHENVLYRRYVRTRDGRAYRFSDVATREEIEATQLHRDVYAPLGINYQLAFVLPSDPKTTLAVVMHREDRDFSDAERDFFNRARPFLIQAYRNAVGYSKLHGRSLEALERVLVGHGLTGREAEVVQLVALGSSNRDVAARLGVSDRTVQKHLERAFRKLGVRTRSAAAARVWQLASA
jgi:DNA-binding CsgD family transcriptional regulator